MKRYILRMVRYTLYIISLFVIILTFMNLAGYSTVTPATLSSIFASSQSMITLGVMLLLIVVHPVISYVKRPLGVDINTSREHVSRIMEGYGYIITKEDDEQIIYNKRNILSRIVSPYEDTIIIYKSALPTMIEGNRKALVRIVVRVKPL